MAVRNRIEHRVEVVVLLIVVLSVVGCGSSGSGTAPRDPSRGKIQAVDVPLITCATDKVPVVMSMSVEVDSTLISPHYYWMMVEKNGEVVECGGGSFSSTQTITFTGFDLDTGEFWVHAGLDHFPTDCANYNLGYFMWPPFKISVGGAICSTITSTMRLEYDCMINRDLRMGGHLHSRLDTVFNAASTAVMFSPDQVLLPDSKFDNRSQFLQFVNLNWVGPFYLGQSRGQIYLAGTKDFRRDGSVFPEVPILEQIYALGFTFPVDGSSAFGDPGCFSIVWKEYLDNQMGSVRGEALLRLCTHELGHGRAGLQHQDVNPYLPDPNHTAGFKCIMVESQRIDPQGQLPPDYKHFCGVCARTLSQIGW